ncbi:MAG: hypothetical protein NT029_10910 [Armatimonadetes bacterium]|nr:hypothetical protein [Armatimonadota bacterium]
MPHALIFSPNSAGHRQVYVCVMADWFLRQGCEVTIAVGRSEPGLPADRSPMVAAVAARPGALVVDLGDTGATNWTPGYWLPRLAELEAQTKPDWTVLPTGDDARHSLAGLGAAGRPTRTRRAALFIRVDHYYRRDLSALPTMQRLGRRVRWMQHNRAERGFFRRRVWKSLGLDAAMSTNVDFLRGSRDARYHYIPEMYRAFVEPMPEPDDATRRAADECRAFLAAHGDQAPIVFFGGRYARRGYDVLLRLAADDESLVFAAAGRPADHQAYRHDPEPLRRRLREQGRIWEAETPFMAVNPLVEVLYGAAPFVLLPYTEQYCLTGTLVEATAFGRPLLAPDIGWMAARIRENGLGLTYRHRDDDDMAARLAELRAAPGRYAAGSAAFGREFQRDRVDAALASVFGDVAHA